MKRKPIIAALLSLFTIAVVYIGCQKNPSGITPGIEPVVPITATLSGRVTDNNHLPVRGATVSSGSAVTTTDLDGYFKFNGLTIKDPNVAHVKVEKSGFFAGSRTYRATSGTDEFVTIQLIKKAAAGRFSALAGGSVTIPENGGKIDFVTQSIVNANGNTPYSGEVAVAAFFINPVSNDFEEMMPGSLRGINTGGQQVGLQSYGMIAVELSGAGNEKLQLAAGKLATLTFPIEATLQAQAPANIPLWSFNDSTGLWKQEGTAVRQGNVYVGTVGHLSFWNCDLQLPMVTFEGKIVNQNGIPIPRAEVLLKFTDNAFSRVASDYTSADGVISGYLPSNKVLELSVYDNCGGIIHTQNIGPFSGVARLGSIVVNTSPTLITRFAGNVINCAGTPLVDGVIDVSINNNHTAGLVINGNFSFLVSRCSGNVAIVTPFDNVNQVQGTSTQYTIIDSIVSTGTIIACGISSRQYFNYRLEGVDDVFTTPNDSIIVAKDQNGFYNVQFDRKVYQAPNNSVFFAFASPSTGSTPVRNISIYKNNYTYQLRSPATISITENGPVGGYMAGSFTADLKRDSLGTYPMTVNFRVKRNN